MGGPDGEIGQKGAGGHTPKMKGNVKFTVSMIFKLAFILYIHFKVLYHNEQRALPTQEGPFKRFFRKTYQ